MIGPVQRPKNAIDCTCARGWHMNTMAWARCHERAGLDRPRPITKQQVKRAVRR